MTINLIDTDLRLPADCQPVEAIVTYRYKYYKESSQQFKRGIIGRWQAFNGYGWDNTEAPEFWINRNIEG